MLSPVFKLYGQKNNDQNKTWTLKACIAYAIQHNIQVQQSINQEHISEATLKETKIGSLPSLNGYASNKYNYGKTVDPFTNEFATNEVRSNSFGLSAQMNLFNGFQHLNTIKKNRYLNMMNQYQTAKIKDDIELNVAAAYLQVLLDDELVSSAQDEVTQSQKQETRIQQLVSAGSLSEDNLYNIEAQVAKDEYNLVSAKNNFNIAKLTLRQLLVLPNNQSFKIEAPKIDPSNYELPSLTVDSLYATAEDTLPQIKVSEYNYQSAKEDLAIARGGRSPQLSLSASYGTGYSGAQTQVTNSTINGVDTVGVTSLGGYMLQPNIEYQTEKKPFSDQLKDNINKSIGFTLSIPIFNGWSVNTNIQKAKIEMNNAQLSLQSAQQDLMKTIQQAYADALATKNNMDAAHKQYLANKKAFQFTKQKFEAGALNSIDFGNAKTQMNQSESTYIQAKYDYIFKLKVLEFYQGKPVTLNE